ncbi:MAG TPA: class I tRNA ligase family protein, partial [Candidatus Nanoarchaeia archaeon]|nr:class I tRNA ligase family protein [Candidatus Nanoarchaeia archaeon]
MSDKYNFKEEEPKWVAFWEKEGVFTFDPKANGEVYSIDTPPPTVSGKMHIGHAFSYTQQDILARYKRLRGFNVFYPWGTDDNGLPTERLVEKMKGVKGSKMDRQDFIKLCEQTLKEILPDFVGDWKRIGVSCDFTKSYSTIDANCRRISQWSFLDLQKKGRAYRKEAPAIWCPLCETAIAQVECQDKEKQTQFVHVEVKTGSGDHVTFATTRPELMMACIAISVHPDDARYKHLVGKTATIPVSGAVVPIIADSLTKMEFGSGVVYWCPYGDAVDVEFVAKHPELKVQHIMNKNGTLNEKAGKYAGLAVIQARKQVIADWQAAGAIKKLEPRSNVVNVHERCGTEIEFYVSPQWFIKYLDLKDKLLDWGAELHWHPDFMKHRYDNWVRGLKWDWCISRQRFFGVPFPVWYCKKCSEPVFADEK